MLQFIAEDVPYTGNPIQVDPEGIFMYPKDEEFRRYKYIKDTDEKAKAKWSGWVKEKPHQFTRKLNCRILKVDHGSLKS